MFEKVRQNNELRKDKWDNDSQYDRMDIWVCYEMYIVKLLGGALILTEAYKLNRGIGALLK